GDYVEAMWLMLQQPAADDYVIATGESHSVREFLELAAGLCGVDWKHHMQTDPRYFRATEADYLLGGPSKARRHLGCTSRVTFYEVVRMMVEHDRELARQERPLTAAGHTVDRGAAQSSCTRTLESSSPGTPASSAPLFAANCATMHSTTSSSSAIAT